MQDVAIVVDPPAREALAGGNQPLLLEQPVSLLPQVVDPRKRPAPGERPEALEVTGLDQLAQAPLPGAHRATRPPELEQLRCGQELVAPDVADQRHVARLQRARNGARDAIVLD